MLYTPTIDYDKKLRKFNENTLISYLYTESNLPNLSLDVNFFNISPEEDNFFDIGIDKLFENYYRKNSTDKLRFSKNDETTFDAKEYLNGGYMYDKNGNYNNNAYSLDINIALLMAEKLTRKIENVNVSGSITSKKNTNLSPTNVRFSGNVSGLNFTATSGKGLIDFADVGPKWIGSSNAKIIVNGVKNDSTEKGVFARVIDFSNVDVSLLKNVTVKDNGVVTVYTKTGSFSGSIMSGVDIKTGSSASTNRAWEEAGRNGTLPSNSLSKLDVKAKANNPLLQKLLDENRPVYG